MARRKSPSISSVWCLIIKHWLNWRIFMPRPHELQTTELGMKVATDLREYIATDSKEAEHKLIVALCSSPSLYEKLFNKKAYSLKQEIIKEELQALREHNANVIQLHFNMYYESFKESSSIYIQELRARGNAHLMNVFEELSAKVISSSQHNAEISNKKFVEMMEDAEKMFSDRPAVLEKRLNGIYRQMDIAMEANEQALKNVLKILQNNIGS